jgi:hypothetical protein
VEKSSKTQYFKAKKQVFDLFLAVFDDFEICEKSSAGLSCRLFPLLLFLCSKVFLRTSVRGATGGLRPLPGQRPRLVRLLYR